MSADGTAGEFVWQTYNEINTRMTNVGSGLVSLGLTKVTNLPLLSALYFFA